MTSPTNLADAHAAQADAAASLARAEEQRPVIDGITRALTKLLEEDRFSWRIEQAFQIGEHRP